MVAGEPFADLSLALDAANEERLVTVVSRRRRVSIGDFCQRERKRRTEMGKIVISENVSLDGVIQDPAGVEGFRLGGWVGRIGDRGREEAARVALDETLRAEASCWVGGATS